MRTIELQISGMTCGACQSHVSKALQSVSGVQKAVVDLPRGTAHVEGEDFDFAALLAAVEEEGYGAEETDTPARTPTSAIGLTAAGCSCGG